MKSVSKRVEEIFALYEKYGQQDYIGEPVSQIEHMSQAAQMAIAGGYDNEVILAAFFHDIGHICVNQEDVKNMDGYGIASHETIGASYLKEMGFSDKILTLIESHVPAKRYLTFVEPAYYNDLSEASKKTLEFQGGVMSAEEAEAFESKPYFKERIQLRKWDEMAKEKYIPIIDLNILKDRTKRHLQQKIK